MQIGRMELLTDEPEVTYENIIPILRKAYPEHIQNSTKIDFLLNYEAGYQPLQRVKKYKTYIDIQCVDNVAHEIAKFHVGYKWANPLNVIQRGEKDSGNADEVEAIALLNECYEAQSIRMKTQRLARFVEVCGVGYTYIDVNRDYTEGDSFFTIEALDPRNAFVIRSSYYTDRRIMVAVTYRVDSHGNKHFTCFTKNDRFEILNLVEIKNGAEIKQKEAWKHGLRSGEMNPLEMIPIIEWVRSDDRMGCFERQIADMDALNILESDICNFTEESVNSIWHCNDIDFPEEEIKNADGTITKQAKTPQNNDWLQTYTSQDGKTPFVTPLSNNFDYEGNLNYALAKRAIILQNADIPSRQMATGGNTGSALNISSGWETTEAIAAAQQNIMESCKMEEIKVVLKAINVSPDVPPDSPLLKLRYMDVQPSIKRNKSYELSVKTSALATMLSHGIHGLHALKVVNLFEDTNQTYADSSELIKRYQDSIFDKGESTSASNDEKLQSLNVDQITNSPIIDGMSREKAEVIE